tara:strand:- start:20258 stop:20776 length:519 start_codon:yes stop_codon:yes gene_type:complete
MARKFSFQIIKPGLGVGTNTFQRDFYREIARRFPDTFPTPDNTVEDTAAYIVNELYDDKGLTSVTAEKEITFDRGIGKKSTQRVLVANFGDGYEQRIKDGLNTKDETYNIKFNNRPWEEIELISAFLDVKTPENFTITIHQEDIKVVCDDYSVTVTQNENQSLTANLRRVYE